MSHRLRLSEETSHYIDDLSRKLGLRRNIICRLATGRSLAEKETVKNVKMGNNTGYEFNRYTLTGDKDQLFKALVNQHERKKLDDGEYFSKYLRNHIERGVRLLCAEYSRINSPVDFLVGLFDKKKGKHWQVELFKK